MKELKVEDWLVQGIESLGGWCPKIAALAWVGFPDRTCLLPGGVLVFVETKTIGGSVKSWQKRVHERLRKLGFRVEVLWTIEQVDAFICSL